LNFETPNPAIDFTNSPFYVNATLKDWEAGQTPRRAGVSSFGIGGTNAHVVLEEAPPCVAAAPVAASAWVLPLSAESPAALSALAELYCKFLSEESSAPLDDIAYTASVRRGHHAHRLAVVGQSREELCASLEAFVRGELSGGVAQGQAEPGARLKVV